MTRFSPRQLSGHGVLLLLSALTIFPLYWMVVTSLRPASDIVSVDLVPRAVTLDNYISVWREIPIARMLVNTLLMSLIVTVAQVLTSLLAAYAFAAWTFPGSRLLFLLFVGTWLVPFQVTMIPNYVLLARLGWLNTLAALVVPQFVAAFAIILLRQYMKAFPRDLLDASRIDGASSWRTLWLIVVPNLRAPLAALAILIFISSWKEYFWPLLVTSKPEQSVVQVGLQMFLSQEGDSWGPLMAGATLACMPVFLLYLGLQRQVTEAFVRSGLK